MTYNIKINNAAEAQELNRIAEKCSYDVWLHGKAGNADAKSLLGMMLLTMESEIRLVVEDSVSAADVEKHFKKFIV